jgi:hypothetical protein
VFFKHANNCVEFILEGIMQLALFYFESLDNDSFTAVVRCDKKIKYPLSSSENQSLLSQPGNDIIKFYQPDSVIATLACINFRCVFVFSFMQF